MIPFKMKIKKYDASRNAYTVEYIPENKKCTPLTLDIHLNVNNPNDTNEVLTSLKFSSPQDYWRSEINKDNANHNTLQSLVNTEHTVTENFNQPTTVTTGFSSPVVNSPEMNSLDGNDDYILRSAQPLESGNSNIYARMSTPERVVGPAAFNDVRLKIAIQQVLREMAEGTV